MSAMSDYQRGYNDGLAVLAIDKLVFAVTAMESAAHWLSRAERNGALGRADRLRIREYTWRASGAMNVLYESLPAEETAE